MRAPVMQGRGFYNQHSEVQARSALEADGVLERALASVAISPGPLTIADFGSSQGRNSMRHAPFDNGDVPGLALEELVIAETPNAAGLRWRQTGDAATFAADTTAFFIAAFTPSLFGDDAALRDLFASRFAEAVALAPAEVARPLLTATLRIVRR